MIRRIPGVWIALAGLATAQAPEAGLLDKLIAFPGSYSQVCDVMTAPEDIPYRAFELTDFAGASFSKRNLAEIGKNRDSLVRAVRARLLAIDFSRKPADPLEDPAPEESMEADNFGCDPATLNPLLLELIHQLDAIEALPELLAVEAKLVKGIARAKNDPAAPAPEVDGWFVGVIGPHDENETDAVRDRRLNLFQARVAQRDLVMLMALLMRGKSHPAYLKTSLEAAYVKGLRAQAKEHGLSKFKPGEPLPEDLKYLRIEIDPVSKLPRVAGSPVMIPYTRGSRDEVRAAAEKWISAR